MVLQYRPIFVWQKLLSLVVVQSLVFRFNLNRLNNERVWLILNGVLVRNIISTNNSL